MQGHHGDAVAGLWIACGRIDPAGANRIAERRQAIAGVVADQYHAAQPQRILEHEHDVGLRHRSDRYQADGALHARIDGVAGTQNVAEHNFRDGCYRRVLEIQIIAVASYCALRPRIRNFGYFGPFEHRGAAPLAGVGLCRTHGLGLSGQNVQGAHFVENVDIGWRRRSNRCRIARCQKTSRA